MSKSNQNNCELPDFGARDNSIEFDSISELYSLLAPEEDQALAGLVEHYPASPTWQDLRYSVITRAEEIELRRAFIYTPRPLRKRLAAMVAVAAILAVSVFSILMLSPWGNEPGLQADGSSNLATYSAWHSDRGTSFQLASHP